MEIYNRGRPKYALAGVGERLASEHAPVIPGWMTIARGRTPKRRSGSSSPTDVRSRRVGLIWMPAPTSRSSEACSKTAPRSQSA